MQSVNLTLFYAVLVFGTLNGKFRDALSNSESTVISKTIAEYNLRSAENLLYPPNRRGGGHIAFCADPVGVRVASCLNQWVDFDQTGTETL